MKTSITEIIRIEKYLSGELKVGDKLLFDGRLIVDKGLQDNVRLHRLVQRLVRLYQRKKMKAEVERVHLKLFGDPAKTRFCESVLQHFNS